MFQFQRLSCADDVLFIVLYVLDTVLCSSEALNSPVSQDQTDLLSQKTLIENSATPPPTPPPPPQPPMT